MTRSISLNAISKTYPKQRTPAVTDITLDVAPGEFLVLLGPTGCGKSTLLRMIAGLEEITCGELLLDGEYANDLAPAARDMAMVFQSLALYPNMTSRENIGFPLQYEARDHDPTSRIEATARMLGIEELLDRYPQQLSGGERQRVAMGRAIARRPSVFLMDEPLSHLDTKLRGRLRTEIAQLTRDMGVTTVYVTHDQTEAMSLGDRVAIMRDGALQQVGSPREAYHLPENVFVATFIGTPRINLWQASVTAPVTGGMWVALGDQRLSLPEPLSRDHQLLRLQQGRPIIVGLRSEAVRLASSTRARPGEVQITGMVEHVDYQGHESLVHLNTGAQRAVVPELEAPRPASSRHQAMSHRRVRRPHEFERLIRKASGWLAGIRPAPSGSLLPVVAGERSPAKDLTGDLVIRADPGMPLHPGQIVPLLVDLAQLFVFDREGRRVCPAPMEAIRLE
ncbi:ABC transporter ATP-binding protein [Streptomyces chartreusis]|uniref:ABC transporter ATP-binding protein n=1 Tax=Streptomyces chartreusis TaxID=1969 RepID=UPI003814A432